MKKCLMKLSIIIFVLLVGFIFFSNSARAVPEKPFLDYAGSFDYTQGVGTGTLSLNSFSFNLVTYLDGTTQNSSLIDPILGAYINIGSLYNTTTNYTYFDDISGSGGGASFVITDGSDTYLSATLGPIDVTTLGTNNALLNIDFSAINLTNVVLGTGFSSRYIDELNQVKDQYGNLNMDFSATFACNIGCSFPFPFDPLDFEADQSGSIQGVVSSPEPVSSLLFIAGGATLAFRRFFRKK